MRFTKYKEQWQQKLYKDIAEIIGGGTPDTKNPAFWNGSINWFTPSEVGSKKYVSISERMISIEGLNKSNAKLLPKGTILLTSRATIGEMSIAENDCATNQGFQSLVAKKNVDVDFLYYLSNTKKKHFIKYACGSTFLEISNHEIRKTKCYIPNIDEQKKIGYFLSKIDTIIETQNKIIKEYETYKKTISNIILYSDKNTYKKLSNFASLKNGYAFKSETYDDNGIYSIITIGNVTGNRTLSIDKTNKICKLPSDIQDHQILKVNDIVVSLTGNVGRTSLVSFPGCLLNQRVGLIEVKDDANRELIFQCLSTSLFEMKMISTGQGAAQLNIGKQDVESFPIPLNITVQQINLLKNIDLIIQKEKDMLNAYKKQKVYLLQNMFI